MTITPHETALEAAAKALASRLDISLGWKDGTAWSMPDVNGNSSVAGFIKDAEEAISAYLSSIGGVVCQREPVGYATELELKQLKLGATVVDLFRNGVADSSVISLHAPLPIARKGDEGWKPIADADSDIAYVHDFGETMRIGNSYPIWARDSDGRVFECLWADDGKKSYWWDIEGESPVDPVEFMPHPLDPRFRCSPSIPSNDTGRA